VRPPPHWSLKRQSAIENWKAPTVKTSTLSPASLAVHKPAAAGQCAPDTAALDLLAELQRRADERAGELARIADDARSRGEACERTHEAAISLIVLAH
jgi:hypothetical protein